MAKVSVQNFGESMAYIACFLKIPHDKHKKAFP